MTAEVTLRIRGDADDVRTKVDALTQSLDRMGKEGEEAGGNATRGLRDADQAADRLRNRIVQVVGAYAGLRGAQEVIRITDAWRLQQGQIALVTEGLAEQQAVTEGVLGVATRTRQELDTTVGLYTRLARSTEDLNLSQEQLLAITETIGQATIVSNASQVEASQAIRQLTQALAGGVLRAEEYNSIIEQTPRLAKVFADGIDEAGGSVGRLRQLVIDGKVSTEDLIRALQNQAAVVAAEFGEMETTVGQAWTNVRTAIAAYLGTSTAAQGVNRALAGTLELLAENLELVAAGTLILSSTQIPRLIGALRTLTGTATAARAALALLGGPAGIAIAAGVALLVFGERALRVSDDTETLTDRVDELTESFKSLAGAELEREIRIIESNIRGLQATLDRLRTQRGGIGEMIFGGQVNEEAAEIEAELNRLQAALRDANIRLNQTRDSAEGAGQGLDTMAASVDRLAGGLPTLNALLDDFEAGIGAAALQIDVLADQSLPALGELLGEFEGEIENAGETYEDLDIRVEDATESMIQSFTRLDEAGVQFWENFFQTGELSLDGIKDLFLRTLAEMVHAATTQQILLSLGFNVAGAPAGGAAGLAGSLIGGGGGLGFGAAAAAGGAGLGGFLFGTPATAGVSGLFGAPVLTGTTTGGLLSGFSGFGAGSGFSTLGSALSGGLGGLSALGAWGGIAALGAGLYNIIDSSNVFGSSLDDVAGPSELIFGQGTYDSRNRPGPGDRFLPGNLGGVGIRGGGTRFRDDLQPIAIQMLQEFHGALVSILGDEADGVFEGLSGTVLSVLPEDVADGSFLEPVFSQVLDGLDPGIRQFVLSVGGNIDEQIQALDTAIRLDQFIAATGIFEGLGDAMQQIGDYQREGESLATTVIRVVDTIAVLREAMGPLGVDVDALGESLVDFAAGFADAAGSVGRGAALWSSFFETFYTEEERAQLYLQRVRTAAEAEFEDIGQSLDSFLGDGGAAEFRKLFEEVLPTLSAEALVEWLEAADALGIVIDAEEALAIARGETADATNDAADATDGFRTEVEKLKESFTVAADAVSRSISTIDDTLSRADYFGGPKPPRGGAIANPLFTPISLGDPTNPEIFQFPTDGGFPVTVVTPLGIPGVTTGLSGGNENSGVFNVGGIGGDLDAFADGIDRIKESVQDFLDGLIFNDRLSPLSTAEQFRAADALFQETLDAAIGGDEGALASLPGVFRNLLELGADTFSTASSQYQQLFDQRFLIEDLVDNFNVSEDGSAAVVSSIQSLRTDLREYADAVQAILDRIATDSLVG